jgi:hypothetical protein
MKKTIYFEDGTSEIVNYDPGNCSHPREYWDTIVVSHSFATMEPEPPEEVFVCGLCGLEYCDESRGAE